MQKSKYIFIKKINKNDIIRDPFSGKKILEEGQFVLDNIFWRSKIKAGILEEIDFSLNTKITDEIKENIKKKVINTNNKEE